MSQWARAVRGAQSKASEQCRHERMMFGHDDSPPLGSAKDQTDTLDTISDPACAINFR